jgi:hypothetical protein
MLKHMEDVNSLAVDLTAMIEKRLIQEGLPVTREIEDIVFQQMFELLEPYCEGDYRNHN